MFKLKKGHQPGVYVPLRALFSSLQIKLSCVIGCWSTPFFANACLKFSSFFFINPSLAFRGFFCPREYPLPLLVAANAGVYIAFWEGNPVRDNGSVNPRLYKVYHMALKCTFQKFLGIV